MVTDAHGSPLAVGNVVSQDRGRMTTLLREVIEINEDRHPGKVRLGQGTMYREMRPSWVSTGSVCKYFNQEFFNVQES